MTDVKPQFNSVDEARGELIERGVSSGTVGDLFDAAKDAVPELLREYGVDDKVDTSEVTRWLQIGFAESCVQFIDEGVWDSAQDGVERIVEDMHEHPVSNATTVAGGMWRRSEDMMRLSAAMMSKNHGER
ncbi:hypothetical protein [Halosimplex halobium]|uniref:hypothetical protein n=1 Tax=Halosimplex halobium TaxID=3396618 RepID=UPI003F55D46A